MVVVGKSQLQAVLEFRRGMEVEACSLATIRGTDQDLLKIKQAHEKLIIANAAGQTGIEENYEFHYAIIVASHNSIYQEVFHTVSQKLKEGIRISKLQSMKLPGRFEEVDKEHRKIIEAMFKRDVELASSAMREHLLNNEQKIWANFKKLN